MHKQNFYKNIPAVSRVDSLQRYLSGVQGNEDDTCSSNVSTRQTLNNMDNIPPGSLTSFSNADLNDIEEIQMRRVSSRFSSNGDNNGGYPGESYVTLEPIDFEYLKTITEDNNGQQGKEKSLTSGLSGDSKKISKINLRRTGSGNSSTASPDGSPMKEAPKRGKRNPWQPHEDAKLIELVDKHGQIWSVLATMLEGRTGKQIRDRYLNILRPNIKKGDWTPQEDQYILALYYQFGTRWCKICSYVPGRTEGQIKNRFYAHIKKKLLGDEMQPNQGSTNEVTQPLTAQAKFPQYMMSSVENQKSEGEMAYPLATAAQNVYANRGFQFPVDMTAAMAQNAGMVNPRNFQFPVFKPEVQPTTLSYVKPMNYPVYQPQYIPRMNPIPTYPSNQSQCKDGETKMECVSVETVEAVVEMIETVETMETVKHEEIDPTNVISYDVQELEKINRHGSHEVFIEQPVQSPCSEQSTQASGEGFMKDEHSVDKALDKMSLFFEKKASSCGVMQAGYKKEELINPQGNTTIAKMERVDQLQKRRNMLEFLLQRTMEEMAAFSTMELLQAAENL